jgi:hypothetical protein
MKIHTQVLGPAPATNNIKFKPHTLTCTNNSSLCKRRYLQGEEQVFYKSRTESWKDLLMWSLLLSGSAVEAHCCLRRRSTPHADAVKRPRTCPVVTLTHPCGLCFYPAARSRPSAAVAAEVRLMLTLVQWCR